ncbi:hypothetical protein IRZ71_21600 [Flavobacterium sp. ANB]|nr:hypothetical protein [Flavobacterium sp. ANB]MTD71570.1 hypothetical protein [Flavobacterium sp. LC2016-13]
MCTNTEIGQLLKLANLMEHFKEHSKDGIASSFADFIDFHYHNTEKHSEKGKENHQNLPFKTINPNVNTVLAFENETMFSLSKPNIISTKRTVPFHKEFYISTVFASIWLPPKLS